MSWLLTLDEKKREIERLDGRKKRRDIKGVGGGKRANGLIRWGPDPPISKKASQGNRLKKISTSEGGKKGP